MGVSHEVQQVDFMGPGYDVIDNQSGLHVGKTKISKKGNSRIRRILHMPSLVIVKHEPGFKVFYDRIYERSHHRMKAYVAVQKKTLVLIYTLWQNDEEFDPKRYLQTLEKESSTDGAVLHKVESKLSPLIENKVTKKVGI